MLWFGESWGAPVCVSTDSTDTPVGRDCGFCNEPIKDGDRGLLLPFMGAETEPKDLPYHLRCFLQSVGAMNDRGGMRV